MQGSNNTFQPIGYGATGYGYTGAMYRSIMEQRRAGENVIMYSDSDKMKVLNRFYNIIQSFFEDEETNKKNALHHFDLRVMSNTSLDTLEPGTLYKQSIGLFYLVRDNPEHIWIRDESMMIKIECQYSENPGTGSLYFSPFVSDKGMIYIGKTSIISRKISSPSRIDVYETPFYCFVQEDQNNLFYADQYYFDRMTLVLDAKNGLLPKLQDEKPTRMNDDVMCLGDLILSGKLSDHKIECIDGSVNVSRALLSMYSDYFMFLFTNGVFHRQSSDNLDFKKVTLIRYIYFTTRQMEKIDVSTSFDEDFSESVHFASYIRDKDYMKFLYEQILKRVQDIDFKTQMDIYVLYKSFGFEFF